MDTSKREYIFKPVGGNTEYDVKQITEYAVEPTAVKIERLQSTNENLLLLNEGVLKLLRESEATIAELLAACESAERFIWNCSMNERSDYLAGEVIRRQIEAAIEKAKSMS